jgi:hypothetical protein
MAEDVLDDRVPESADVLVVAVGPVEKRRHDLLEGGVIGLAG